jgi:hypothetical protein
MLSPYLLIQLVCIALFIYGIRLMNSPKTAVAGQSPGGGGHGRSHYHHHAGS